MNSTIYDDIQTSSDTDLVVSIGSKSVAGIKPINEDCAGFFVPDDNLRLQNKGIALAIADGVSTAEAGQEASVTPSRLEPQPGACS